MRCAPALALLLACTPGGGGETGGSSDESGGSTTDAPVPEPAFISPAVGEFIVQTDQIFPESLLVQRTIPGTTQVLLDGYSLGTLTEDSRFGALTEDSLDLTLHGAMIAGTHELQLINPSPEGPRGSVTLTMVIEAPAAETRPTWHAELTPTDITDGTALLASGVGAGRVLGVVTPGDPDPFLQLMRVADDGWTVDEPIGVPLDGHVPGAMSLTPAVAAVAFPEPDGGPPKRMRVAFRVGQPGTSIAARDIVINPSPIILNTFTAFTADAALAGLQVEWTAFGRPFLLGHTLLAELVAAADTETPHPGDRRVVTSFWRGDDLQWTPPQLVGMPAPTDVDALGPAPILPDIPGHAAAALSVRLGGAYPGLLEVRDDGSVSITTPTNTAPLAPSGDLSLATIVANFGARTVVAVDRDGRVGLSLLHTSGDNAPRDSSPGADDLPDAAPTGAPAPGVSLGFPFFLIPYGDAAAVHLVLSDGHDAAVQPLDAPEPLHCDAVALAATLDGNDPDEPALPFACLSHGVLHVGRLIATPPPG